MNNLPAASQPIEIVLPIEGMTCASCVNRIERFLKKTPGVELANVNLATEKATVLVDPGIAGRDELVKAVEAAEFVDRMATLAFENPQTLFRSWTKRISAMERYLELRNRHGIFGAPPNLQIGWSGKERRATNLS